MRTIDRVVAALSGKRYGYRDERDLHDGLAAAFDDADVDYRHEVHITGGRIDFVVGRVGVEVKIKGSVADLQRQIEGYAPEAAIDEFLVVTTRPTHRAIPRVTSNGKPVRVITIGALSL